MRIGVYIICLLFTIPIQGQQNYFYSHDHNSLSQSYTDAVAYEDYLYTFGVTICEAGECAVLSRYDNSGNLLFLKEIDHIDATSFRCLEAKEDTIVLIGLSKYEIGARMQMYDLEGELFRDKLINRDTNLVYTWPLDVLYTEDCIYLAVNENYENESRQAAIYKLDYQGNVIDYIRLPYHFRGKIYTLSKLLNGNLFVTQSYIDDDLCAFEHGEPDNVNAVIFYEISSDSLEIIREKRNVCYRSTNPVSYDCRVLSNNTIVRNILWTDSINDNIIHAANIYYAANWEVIGIDKYPQLIVGNPLASYGILNNRTFPSLDSNYFYNAAFKSYPLQNEDFPYVDFLIQKWDINRNLIWERVISDPNVHHRIYFNSINETGSEIILSGLVWSDFDVAGTRDFAIMSLDLDGCYNGDCSDTIYLNGPPTSVFEEEDFTDISIFPNPVLDELTVRSSSPLRSMVCYALDGTVMIQEELISLEHTFDMSSFPLGMYIVRIVSDAGIRSRKIMKQ